MASQFLESGVRTFEAGYFCPDLCRLNFLPFAAETEPARLLNRLGTQGPLLEFDLNNLNVHMSGVMGIGTPYPISGTMEQISRMFWCVKSWLLSIHAVVVPSTAPNLWVDPLISTIILPGAVFDGLTSCTLDSTTTKTLVLQDLYAGPYLNVFDPIDGPFNIANYQNISPIDPIQKFEDLMCRGKGFSWTAPEYYTTGFFGWSQNQFDKEMGHCQWRIDFGGMDFETSDEIFPDPPNVWGLCNLSLMNVDHLCVKAGSTIPLDAIQCPLITEMEPLEQSGAYELVPQTVSGALTRSGEITGYGYYPIPSGNLPNLAYRYSCEDQADPLTQGCDISKFNPTSGRNFFPYVNFTLFMRTAAADLTPACPFSAVVSSIQRDASWKSVGTLQIGDVSLLNPNKQLFQIPLYAPNGNVNILITASLQPNSFWIKSTPTESGTVNW